MAFTQIQKTAKHTLGLAPQSVATTTKTGTFWSLENAHGAAFVFVIGTVAAAVTLSIIQGTAAGSTGGSTKTISGKSTAVGTADANSVKILEVDASELDVANSYISVAAKVVAAGAGAIVGAVCIRRPLRYSPPSYIT